MAHIYPIDNKNLLFINPPKCATNSVDKLFQMYYEPANYRALTYVKHPTTNDSDNPLRGHLTFRQVEEMKKITDSNSRYPTFWNKFSEIHYSFSTIRNPWARMVSWYHYLKQYHGPSLRGSDMDGSPSRWRNMNWEDMALDLSFEDFVYHWVINPKKYIKDGRTKVFLPQIEYIIDENGVVSVDFLVDCENLMNNMNKMFKKFNIFIEHIKIKKPDLRKNPSIPEINNYNPMANIEEPPLPPDALNLSPIMNTNAFNQSSTPLNNYRYNSNS